MKYVTELEETVGRMSGVYTRLGVMADEACETGLRAVLAMGREYINACRKNFADGHDFVMGRVELTDYQIKYLAEKFDTAFGAALRNKKNRAQFFKEMGWPEKVKTDD